MTPKKNDDDETTPVESPSAAHKLGLAVCPCCEGSGIRDGEPCGYCDGARRVTLARHHAWIGLHPVSKDRT